MELSRRSFILSTTAVAGATLAGQSADDRPQAYRKEAAEDGWKRCLAFFDKHLKG
jgi:dienelactone hydrolase